jgi:REP-associated tyrosine transposase
MSQTLTSLLVHLVFSTKNREPLITPDVEPNLFAYIGGILRNNQSRLLDAGGDRDHVHLLISQSNPSGDFVPGYSISHLRCE